MPPKGNSRRRDNLKRTAKKPTAVFDGKTTEEMSKEQLEILVSQLKEEVNSNFYEVYKLLKNF